MKVYLASSWKNIVMVRKVAEDLRKKDIEVEDFTDPSNGHHTFCWQDIEPSVRAHLNTKTFVQDHRTVEAYFEDIGRIEWCDALLMIMPCAKSSHIEFGYAKALGKKCLIYYPGGLVQGEFETMYVGATLITDAWDEIVSYLRWGYRT